MWDPQDSVQLPCMGLNSMVYGRYNYSSLGFINQLITGDTTLWGYNVIDKCWLAIVGSRLNSCLPYSYVFPFWYVYLYPSYKLTIIVHQQRLLGSWVNRFICCSAMPHIMSNWDIRECDIPFWTIDLFFTESEILEGAIEVISTMRCPQDS